MKSPIHISYDRGTLQLGGSPDFDFTALPGVAFDPRTETHRAQGRHYRAIVEHLIRSKITYADEARGWDNADSGFRLRVEREPFPHQKEAVEAWMTTRRGCVVLPTGTGKTYVAILAIARVN